MRNHGGKMMKTGTITFHASHNCGSMLQAYALQYVLTQKLGQENEIIDFSNKAQQNVYGLINKKLRPGIVKRNIKLLPYLKYIKREREDYEAFKRDHFILSDGFYEKTAQMGNMICLLPGVTKSGTHGVQMLMRPIFCLL